LRRLPARMAIPITSDLTASRRAQKMRSSPALYLHTRNDRSCSMTGSRPLGSRLAGSGPPFDSQGPTPAIAHLPPSVCLQVLRTLFFPVCIGQKESSIRGNGDVLSDAHLCCWKPPNFPSRRGIENWQIKRPVAQIPSAGVTCNIETIASAEPNVSRQKWDPKSVCDFFGCEIENIDRPIALRHGGLSATLMARARPSPRQASPRPSNWGFTRRSRNVLNSGDS
jgi:hypothetical protein